MTTEEKARAYDEALERARKQRDDYQKELNKTDKNSQLAGLLRAGISAVEMAFPELKESEDERIRQAIIHYILYETKGAISEATEHTWVKWLEKQKEPENVSASTIIPSCWEIKQKEQKPDSLIYDKDLDKAAREFYLSGGAASPVDSTGLVPIVRMAEFGATWMKERMEKEQKPCWNPTEEDVALFNKAITTNASLSPQERAKLDILRMKFKHRPVIEQKEQKPAWSEEDEDYMKAIITIINRETALYPKGGATEDLNNDLITWLKSLSPSWKPSEEQMNALKNSAYGTYQNGDGPILRGLYEQLLKLGVK